MIKKIQNFCISTSSIDKDYYVIDKNIKDIELFMLVSALEINDDLTYSNLLLKYYYLKNTNQKNLFIKKESNLGKIITYLISQEKVVDLSNYISKEILLNALINEIEKEELDDVFIKSIYQMIRRRECGSKETLLANYSEELLDKIIKQGRNQEYLPLLNTKTLQENKFGYLYDDELGWCNFNIETKELSIIEEMSNKKNIYEVINIIPKKTKKRTKKNINEVISILAGKSK